jgi:CheY-like chemotaxis protein
MAKKILVIDDEELVIKSISKLLTKNGYAVTVVKSGKDALEKLKNTDFDLTICDVRMPQMDGIETIKQMRAYLEKANKKSPSSILITGYVDPDKYDLALDLEVANYLPKPFDNKELLEAVKNTIGGAVKDERKKV